MLHVSRIQALTFLATYLLSTPASRELLLRNCILYVAHTGSSWFVRELRVFFSRIGKGGCCLVCLSVCVRITTANNVLGYLMLHVSHYFTVINWLT